MRRKALNVATIESHAGLDEVQIELLGLPAFDVSLLAIALSENGQIGSEL